MNYVLDLCPGKHFCIICIVSCWNISSSTCLSLYFDISNLHHSLTSTYWISSDFFRLETLFISIKNKFGHIDYSKNIEAMDN